MGKESERSQWFLIGQEIYNQAISGEDKFDMRDLIKSSGLDNPHRIQTLLQERFYGVFKRVKKGSDDYFVFLGDEFKNGFISDMAIISKDMKKR